MEPGLFYRILLLYISFILRIDPGFHAAQSFLKQALSFLHALLRLLQLSRNIFSLWEAYPHTAVALSKAFVLNHAAYYISIVLVDLIQTVSAFDRGLLGDCC